MGISILRFDLDGRTRFGVKDGDQVCPLDMPCATTGELVSVPRDVLLGAAQRPVPVASVTLRSPVTSARVLCQGANYRQHMIESGLDPDAKTFNMFFTKSSASLHDPVGTIKRPPHVRLLDYEIELALVLSSRSRRAMTVATEALRDHVAGVCIANDVSARDVQIPQMQFHKGKSYRTFCPMGPVLYLLDPDEFHVLDDFLLTLTVNGERRQHDHTGNLVHRPAESLSEFSEVSDFDPGDVLLTGTPAGCALRLPPPVAVRAASLLPDALRWSAFVKGQARRREYLRAGDVVESRIVSRDGRVDLGTQRHVVEDAPEVL